MSATRATTRHRELRRAPSTVSREVQRHGGRRRYRAAAADAAAWARGRRPKRCRLATHSALRDAVATKLAHAWAPQQIAGWLRRAYPHDPPMHVSHETIYLSLFVQSRGVLKKALQAQLRQRHTIRRPRTAAPTSGGYIVGAVSIRECPATVEDRAVPGHWEGDLLVGARQSYVATLVERHTIRRPRTAAPTSGGYSGVRATCVSSGWPDARRARSCGRSPSTCGDCPPASWPR